MKYYTWKINNGVDASYSINSSGTARVEPVFSDYNNIDENSTIYVYCISGSINVQDFSDWQVTEITQQQFLDAARLKDPSCSFDENGFIVFNLTAPEYL